MTKRLSAALIVVFAMINSGTFNAQPVNSYFGDVVMPAPNAAALGKYGDIPVSLYTGVPDIGVPLYTIKDGALILPISLSFHASGLKAGERASWVGMGWSLNAGGIVTRVVQGLPDDHAGGYYHNGSGLQSTSTHVQEVADGLRDGEADIFTYNIGGYSGKFFFDRNMVLIKVPQNDVKITHFLSSQKFVGFEFITPDGTVYLFGDNPNDNLPSAGIEQTAPEGGAGGPESYNSSWYPVRISSYDGKQVIDFEYVSENYITFNVSSCSYVKGSGIQMNGSTCTNADVICPGNWTATDIMGLRLNKIANKTSTIDFVASASDRQDLYACKKLDKITIKDGSTNAYYMTYELQHTYWDDAYAPQQYANHTKRLRLNGIVQKNCDNTSTAQTFSFQYETSGENGPDHLPHIFTKAIDHWGFFNGQNGNNNLLVNAPVTSVTNGPATIVNYGLANRESDYQYMRLGTLNKITYPTGGYTRFEYEANTYPRWQVVDSTISYLIQGLQTQPPYCPPAFYPCCSGVSPQSSATLSNPIGEYYFDLILNSDNLCVGPPEVRVDVFSSANVLLGSYGFTWSTNGPNALYGKLLSTIPVNFVQGQTYKFQVEGTEGIGTFNLYRKVYNQNWFNAPVGGLRVKTIVNNPGQAGGTEEIIASYEYKDASNPSKSSGILYTQPLYGFGYALTNNSWYYSTVLSQAIVPLGDYQGYHIAYQRVAEIRPNNGKKIYEFEAETPAGPPTYYPIGTPALNVKTGQLKKEQVYLESPATLLQETTNTPDNVTYLYAPGIMYKAFKAVVPGCTVSPSAFYAKTDCSHRTATFRVSSTAQMRDGVTQSSAMTYHAGAKHLVKDQTTTVDGKTYVNRYKYAMDLGTAAGIRMVLQNRIGMPVESSLEVGGLQVSGEKTEYGFFNTADGTPTTNSANTNPVYPHKYHSYEMTWTNGVPVAGAWTLKGTVNKYTIAHGRPSAFTMANWPLETYVWASNGLIQSRTYLGYSWQYDYYPGTRLLRSITDIDGRKSGFTYDNFMRLTKSTQDNASVNGSGIVVDGNVKNEFTYHYKETNDPYNWIKLKTTYTPSAGSSLTTTETFDYLDGLGRSSQTVRKAWSPAYKDVVSAFLYDQQGRVVRQYTPFETTGNTGAYTAVPANQKHILMAYEASPLNRVLSVTPPDWYPTTTIYGANAASEVGYYNGLTATSFFPANSLAKTTVRNPQSSSKNVETVTYTDRRGRVVLSRRRETGSTTNVADTYTLYDNKSRVVRMLPPGVGTGAGDADRRFEYSYDAANRTTMKKTPDMAAVNMRYNLRDQLVLAQDGNQLAAGKWLLAKFDDYGRPISTGLHTGSNPDPNNAGLTFSQQHTALTYGTAGVEVGKTKTRQTWLPGNTSITRTYTYNTVTGRLLTDNGANHLNANTGTDNYTFVYDYAGNLLTETRAHKTSAASATLTLLTRHTYDHAGRSSALFHKIDAAPEVQLAAYTYDFRDRLIDKGLGAVSNAVTNSFLQSVDYAYNEQDWLTSINGPSSFSALSQSPISLCPSVPGTPNPVEAAFAANPDGNDIFKLDLYYDNPGLAFGAPTGQRNGNISQLIWQVRGRQRQGYTLQYDYLDRLTSSYYTDINAAGTASTDNKYQENITYADARGNIASIVRNGLFKTPVTASCWTLGQIDNLTFTYNTGSNRLQKIADAAPAGIPRSTGFNPGSYATTSSTFSYDANGNLVGDPYRGVAAPLAITYNHLNLPIQFSWLLDPLADSYQHILVTYDHAGKKLRKQVQGTGGILYSQDYADGLEYRTNGSGGSLTLEAIYHAEGRITPLSAGAYRYEYTIKDHLGNARLSFADLNGNKIVDVPEEIVQENHYYPFGLNANYSWMNNTTLLDNRYQYNGKELNDDFGLNWNDYGARWYDAAVGRWWSVDPMAEKYVGWSPYNYVYNNPINGIDPDGRDGILIVFPNYKVDTETRLGKQPLGHAGVLLINNKTGFTKYYEYGRYPTDDGTKGKVRTIAVPNVVIGKDGKPTQESLNKVLGKISEKAGQGGKIEGAYVEGDFTKMNDYAQKKLKESNPQYTEYDKDRESYSLTGNNCGTFSCDVLKQDSDSKKRAPWIFNPTPNNIAEEYQDEFPAVNYDPKTKTTTSDIYKKKD